MQIYVSEETLAQLNFHARNDSQGRTAEQLAEDCVADAAIRDLPLDWREQLAETGAIVSQ